MAQVLESTEAQRNYLEKNKDELISKKLWDGKTPPSEMSLQEASKIIDEHKKTIPATEKQLGLIGQLKLGDGADVKNLSAYDASKLLDSHFSKPISQKQQELLLKNGLVRSPETAATMSLREFQRRWGAFMEEEREKPISPRQRSFMNFSMKKYVEEYCQKTGKSPENFQVKDYLEVRSMRNKAPITDEQKKLVGQLVAEIEKKDPKKFKQGRYEDLLKPEGLAEWTHGRVQGLIKANQDIFYSMPATPKQIEILVQQGLVAADVDPASITRSVANELFNSMSQNRQERGAEKGMDGHPAPEDIKPVDEAPITETLVDETEDVEASFDISF